MSLVKAISLKAFSIQEGEIKIEGQSDSMWDHWDLMTISYSILYLAALRDILLLIESSIFFITHVINLFDSF